MADVRALNQVLLRDLNEFLYPKNDFITGNAMFDSQGADADIVVVNESQEQPFIVENQTVFPLPVQSTEDANKSYRIDTLRTLPTYIEDVDEILTVFDKRANELKKHARSMQTQFHDKIANLWALPGDADAVIRTSGAAAEVINGDMTGNRKQLTRSDWIKAITTLAKQEVPTDGLVALVDEAMYWNIYELPEFTQYNLTGKEDPVRGGGAIGELMGVRIYRRNGVPFYSNDATPVLQPYTVKDSKGKYKRNRPAADSNLSVMMWHPAFVRYSFGNEKVYSEIDSPTLQGSVFSTRLRAGAMRSRLDDKGVVMIIQEP